MQNHHILEIVYKIPYMYDKYMMNDKTMRMEAVHTLIIGVSIFSIKISQKNMSMPLKIIFYCTC